MAKPGKKTILLVEDEVLIAMAEKQDIEDFGYNVLIANSGEEAKTVFNSNEIDLILMDIDLGSGIDGTETAEIILEDNDVPVIFLSSHTEPEIVEKTEKITSYGYVVKNTGKTVLDTSIKMAFKLFGEKQIVRKKQQELILHEAKLQEREPGLQEAQRLAQIGEWDIDLLSGELIWSDELYRICHVDPGRELDLSELLDELIHPDDKAMTEQAMQDALSTGELLPFEFRIIRVDGEERILWCKGRVIYNAHGEAVKLVGIDQDITERKQAEEILQNMENLLNETQQMAALASWEWNPKTNEVLWSQEIYNLLGYEVGGVEPSVEAFISSIHPEDIGYATRSIKKSIERDSEEFDNYRIIKQNGSVRHVEVKTRRIFDDNEDLTKIIGFLMDITDRKLSEEALHDSEEKHRALIENLSDMIMILDKDGVNLWNSPTIKQYGMELENIIGINARDYTHPDDLEQVDKVLNYCVKHPGEAITARGLKAVADDGRILYLDNTFIYLPDTPGINGIVVTCHNVTDNKLAEEEVQKTFQQKKDLLKELQHRAKNSFILITSMISLMEDSTASDEAKSVLNELSSRINALSVMYDLLYSTDSIKEVRVDIYLDRVVSLLPVISGSITLKITFDEVILPVKSAISVGLIITELMTNSIKHAFPDNRKGTLDITLKKRDAGVIIEFKDDGAGLPEGFDLSAINSLGLILVSQLVKQLDGSIKIESNKGTHCVVEFPI